MSDTYNTDDRVESNGETYRLVSPFGSGWWAAHESTGLACLVGGGEFRHYPPSVEDAEKAGMMATLNNVGVLITGGISR